MRDDPIAEIATERFKVRYLYPIQRYVISNILDGINQIVVLPTGAGKSLCYWLPLECTSGITLVISPLLALMKDQLRRLSNLGIEGGCLMGGQSGEERQTLFRDLRAGRLKIVFITPETLLRVASSGLFTSLEIDHIVIDEAHCVSEWGRTFRPSYRRIGGIIGNSNVGVITAFTATASDEIVADIRRSLFGDRAVSLTTQNPDRPNIFYRVQQVLCKSFELVRLLAARGGCSVVFSMSRGAAEKYARTLKRRLPDRETYFYHAGLSKEERIEIEAWFMDSSNGILVSTSAYGLGVDKSDIRTVIHVDLPPSVEAFLQESGRAGRDGRPAQSILLHTAQDLSRLPKPENPFQRTRYELVKAYALNRTECRRSLLLSLIGQDTASCSGCDICSGEPVCEPWQQDVILDLVRRNRRLFTKREFLLLLGGIYYTETVTKHLDLKRGFGALSKLGGRGHRGSPGQPPVGKTD